MQTESQKPGRARHVHILADIHVQSSTQEPALASFGCHSLTQIDVYIWMYAYMLVPTNTHGTSGKGHPFRKTSHRGRGIPCACPDMQQIHLDEPVA